MDLNKFDTTLKSALDHLEVPFDPSSWAAFEARLDKLPAADAIDQALRPTLERIETPFDAASWSALANRMDVIAKVRRLRFTKLAELSIFLLLLLNLKGFFGMVESVTAPAPGKKEVVEPMASRKSLKNKKHTANSPQITQPLENLSLTDHVLSFVQSVANSFGNAEATQPEMVSISEAQSLAENTSVLDPGLFYQSAGPVKFDLGKSLPLLDMQPIAMAGSFIQIPGLQPSVTPKQTHFYAASYVSLDQNFVKEGSYNAQNGGYGGGLMVGYRKGKWGFESGLQYSQKNYKPERKRVEYQNDPVNGVSFFYTDQVDAEVFSLPLKATRRIAKFGKGSAHAVAGVTAHFAATKDFAYNTEHKPPINLSGNPTTQQFADFPDGKGVFEKGGLKQNAYTTADLGIRVEHSVGKKYVAFVEPVYRQSIGGGLGPNGAKLSTFSLQAGVMASL